MTNEEYTQYKLKRSLSMMQAEGQALLIITLGIPFVVALLVFASKC
jgi:hypothetical protein